VEPLLVRFRELAQDARGERSDVLVQLRLLPVDVEPLIVPLDCEADVPRPVGPEPQEHDQDAEEEQDQARDRGAEPDQSADDDEEGAHEFGLVEIALFLPLHPADLEGTLPEGSHFGELRDQVRYLLAESRRQVSFVELEATLLLEGVQDQGPFPARYDQALRLGAGLRIKGRHVDDEPVQVV
jgi:hypothetical protein